MKFPTNNYTWPIYLGVSQVHFRFYIIFHFKMATLLVTSLCIQQVHFIVLNNNISFIYNSHGNGTMPQLPFSSTIRGPFSIRSFRCSVGDGGGSEGEEDEAAGRFGEELARGACRGIPQSFIKFDRNSLRIISIIRHFKRARGSVDQSVVTGPVSCGKCPSLQAIFYQGRLFYTVLVHSLSRSFHWPMENWQEKDNRFNVNNLRYYKR